MKIRPFSHVPMISKETWDAIQRVRESGLRPRKRQKDRGLIFLNFATCGSCGHCITGERHTKKKSGLQFFYYRCSHKNAKRGCTNTTFIRQGDFADELRRNVQLVTVPPIWKERFLAKIEQWESEESTAKQAQLARLRAELALLRTKADTN
jgi:hypothetical protein